MSITEKTKEEFHHALKEEFGEELDRRQSDEVLNSLTKFYVHLGRLHKKVEAPQKSQW